MYFIPCRTNKDFTSTLFPTNPTFSRMDLGRRKVGRKKCRGYSSAIYWFGPSINMNRENMFLMFDCKAFTTYAINPTRKVFARTLWVENIFGKSRNALKKVKAPVSRVLHEFLLIDNKWENKKHYGLHKASALCHVPDISREKCVNNGVQIEPARLRSRDVTNPKNSFEGEKEMKRTGWNV